MLRLVGGHGQSHLIIIGPIGWEVEVEGVEVEGVESIMKKKEMNTREKVDTREEDTREEDWREEEGDTHPVHGVAVNEVRKVEHRSIE